MKWTRSVSGRTIFAAALAWTGFIGFLLASMEGRGWAKPAQERADDWMQARFGYCAGSGSSCVVDGDTFRLKGRTYRIADIDTPETHDPRCAAEAALGVKATRRLAALLNAGAFSLEPIERERDRYGRTMRVVTRNGRSIGAMLVQEGLARRWDGRRLPWCRADGSVSVQVRAGLASHFSR